MQHPAQGSTSGDNPDLEAMKSAHSAAINSNEKIFPVFAKKLASKDTKEYANTVRKFAHWLGSEKAYYPAARPKIVQLLEVGLTCWHSKSFVYGYLFSFWFLDCSFKFHGQFRASLHRCRVLLVDNRMIDEAMSQFSRVHSVHIYSLSPSRFVDAGLVCTPSIKVHKADAKGGPEFFSVVGKIMGSHIKLRDGAVDESVASSSKPTLVTAKMAPKLAGPTKAEHQMTKGKAPSSDTKGQVATTPLQRTESKEKPKLSGKLDWKPDSPVAAMHSSTSRKTGLEPTKSSAFKSKASGIRGMKRKPLIDTDQESESESSSVKAKLSTAGGSSVKRGVVYSDEDDDGEVRMLCQRRRKRKGTVTSDSEMSLRAIMDIDDGQVDHVSRADKVLPQPEELEESEEEGNKPEKEATVCVQSGGRDESQEHLVDNVVAPSLLPRTVVVYIVHLENRFYAKLIFISSSNLSTFDDRRTTCSQSTRWATRALVFSSEYTGSNVGGLDKPEDRCQTSSSTARRKLSA
ncbi:hypothetical protein JVT61DRAFT_9077 [Boletus reticuloceps]|uniref:DNA polymerase delta subunit 3 n=1 Tax=Boletus reticuloceps TaxID=495285 RepID=A0A8I2YGU7_9AGAM|nr:hypothetical protein JVT61DRAFT_9077 [Boletus reticuloceps]